jgi:hypothetical protein
MDGPKSASASGANGACASKGAGKDVTAAIFCVTSAFEYVQAATQQTPQSSVLIDRLLSPLSQTASNVSRLRRQAMTIHVRCKNVCNCEQRFEKQGGNVRLRD